MDTLFRWIWCLRSRSAIAVDGSNNVYAWRNASVGAGNIDALLVKYNALGSILWQRMLGRTNNDQGKAIAIDSSDNIYMCGDTSVTGNSEILLQNIFVWNYPMANTLGGTDGSGNNNTHVYSAAIDGLIIFIYLEILL